MREYGKVHTSFWTSPTVRAMSEDARALALYLLTSQHGTIAGVFRLPDGYASDDMQWLPSRVQAAFAELEHEDFVARCGITQWAWLKKYFVWNPPENPNQRKAVAKVFAAVPASCNWRAAFISECGQFFDLDSQLSQKPQITVPEPLARPSDEVLKRFRNQEKEQQQEQQQEKTITIPGGIVAASRAVADQQSALGKKDCPHQEIIALYHEILPQCPQVRAWTPARAAQLRARWNEDERRQNLDYWRKFFEYVGGCDFLVGRAGGKPFLADLEWMTKSNNFTKIREQKYENRG